jgi:hypothetical protein
VAFFAALFSAVPALGQEGRQDAVSLIPRLVYVGDPARLVMELGPGFSGIPGEVIDDPLLLPAARDLVISRVELENRQGRVRLLVDFTAYAPGRRELPPIRVGALVFSTLEVQIASILDAETAGDRRAGAAGSNRVLSPPAPPLTAPGTMAVIYGAVVTLILLMGGIAAGRRSAPLIRRRLEQRRRRKRFRALERLLRQLAETLDGGGGTREVLERLNREFRVFLVFLTGAACLTMVPGEFEALPDPGGTADDGFGGPWLCRFFRRADTLRFRGGEAAVAEAAELLEETRRFLAAVALRENAALRDGDTGRDGGPEAGKTPTEGGAA